MLLSHTFKHVVASIFNSKTHVFPSSTDKNYFSLPSLCLVYHLRETRYRIFVSVPIPDTAPIERHFMTEVQARPKYAFLWWYLHNANEKYFLSSTSSFTVSPFYCTMMVWWRQNQMCSSAGVTSTVLWW